MVDMATQVTTTPNFDWHQAQDTQSLADHLANEIAARLQAAIRDKGRAFIAVSGGSTPKPMFAALADADIDWSRVVITLVDERWVPESHDLSNAAFLRTHLLSKLPSQAVFVPLYHAAESVENSFEQVLSAFAEVNDTDGLPRFDVVVLGMGGDGHTASFFPDASNVAQLVDPSTKQALLSCESPSTQVARITWSLPVLLNTDFLALHFTGEAKKRVFETALEDTDATVLPIRSALFQSKIPLQVFYAD